MRNIEHYTCTTTATHPTFAVRERNRRATLSDHTTTRRKISRPCRVVYEIINGEIRYARDDRHGLTSARRSYVSARVIAPCH